MSFVRLLSFTLRGIEAEPVAVEVSISSGLPCFAIVGLADKAISESRERIRAGIESSGFKFPMKRIVVSLCPSSLPKSGPHLDLAIAAGIVIASGQAQAGCLAKAGIVGGISLSGEVLKVRGALTIALACERHGISPLFLPLENGLEASMARGTDVRPVRTIRELFDGGLSLCELSGDRVIKKTACATQGPLAGSSVVEEDFGEVVGHELAKRALEIAVVGRHNILFVGPPGVGKTMLAQRLVSIMPPLSPDECLEVTSIYSAAGLLRDGQLITSRPFRAPHHTISEAGMVGGGSPLAPGEITLAHKGVLFLDEFPLFKSNVIQSLREPLENDEVVLRRASYHVRLPAQFMLVASMNPCPCGYLGVEGKVCTCTASKIDAYRSKIAGPIYDRIDMQVFLIKPRSRLLLESSGPSTTSVEMRQRILRALEFRSSRGARANSCEKLSSECEDFVAAAAERLCLSPRAIKKVLKVARSIADLDLSEEVTLAHVSEAVSYRTAF